MILLIAGTILFFFTFPSSLFWSILRARRNWVSTIDNNRRIALLPAGVPRSHRGQSPCPHQCYEAGKVYQVQHHYEVTMISLHHIAAWGVVPVKYEV